MVFKFFIDLATHLVNGYPDSYYSRTIHPSLRKKRPPLRAHIETEVCVIGGGLAGVNTALGLVERGKDVVIIEQQRIGYAASGRNGGFVIPGFSVESEDLLHQIGARKASTLYQLSLDGYNLLRERVNKWKIPCDLREQKYLCLSVFNESQEDVTKSIDELNKFVGTSFSYLPKSRINTLFSSNFYKYGVVETNSCTVHPLNLTLGLAKNAEKQGCRIFEHTKAIAIQEPYTSKKRRWEIVTKSQDGSTASVLADTIVLAGNTDVGELDNTVKRSITPVYTWIMVTEPIEEDKWKLAFPSKESESYSVTDDRFALDYYRILPGRKLLWGGLAETYPIKQETLPKVMTDLVYRVYPQLKDSVKPEVIWGGTMGFGFDFMPLIGRSKEKQGVWYATGFAGHGLVPTTMAGELLASAIASEGKDKRYEIFEELYKPKLMIGGTFFGHLYKVYSEWQENRELKNQDTNE